MIVRGRLPGGGGLAEIRCSRSTAKKEVKFCFSNTASSHFSINSMGFLPSMRTGSPRMRMLFLLSLFLMSSIRLA